MEVIYPSCCGIDVHAKTAVVVIDSANIKLAQVASDAPGVSGRRHRGVGLERVVSNL